MFSPTRRHSSSRKNSLLTQLLQAGGGAPPGPPYPPQAQGLGLTPSVIPDIPINAVFLLFFILGGAGHMALMRINMAKGKKFVLSGMVFGFCVTRVCATVLRIAWAIHQRNVQLGIAAQIFVYAGIILLFIINLFFAQRIVRAQHPHFGWSKPFSILIPALLVIIVGTILALIASVVVQFYTLSDGPQAAARNIQLYGAVLYAVITFLPIPIVGASTLARRLPQIKNTRTMDKFGGGSMRFKVAFVLFSAVILCLGASYRAGTSLLDPVPLSEPSPWYLSKASFYVFNFGLELFIVWFWLLARIDILFHIPNGAKGPFSYGGGFVFAGETGNEKNKALGNRDSMRHLTDSQVSGFASTTNPRESRVSWGGSRNSMAGGSRRASRVSWGGISREDVSGGLGEDGIEVMPYPGFEHQGREGMGYEPSAADVGVEGAESEMGWDSKSGKWALRPVSRVPQVGDRGTEGAEVV